MLFQIRVRCPFSNLQHAHVVAVQILLSVVRKNDLGHRAIRDTVTLQTIRISMELNINDPLLLSLGHWPTMYSL